MTGCGHYITIASSLEWFGITHYRSDNYVCSSFARGDAHLGVLDSTPVSEYGDGSRPLLSMERDPQPPASPLWIPACAGMTVMQRSQFETGPFDCWTWYG